VTDPQPIASPWWYHDVLTAILTAVLAGIAAFVGGKWGVARDTEKLRKQRAFEDRLDWYMRISKTIAQFQFVNAALMRSDGADVDERILSLKQKMRDLAFTLSTEGKEALFFASGTTIESLETMNSRLNKLRRESSGLSASAYGLRIQNELARVHSDLARDVRGHLDLDELDERPKREVHSTKLSGQLG